MRSNTSLKWYQFRLRSLLAAVLIVQLACILSPHLVRMYREYESERRRRAAAAKIDVYLARCRVNAVNLGRHVSSQMFEYDEGLTEPVLLLGETAGAALSSDPMP